MSEDSGVNMTEAAKGFAEIGRLINAWFPTPPDQGYLGNRCGWYPAKPKRKRRSAT